ncbi:MAG: hypothetical protein IVW56_11455 [Candidatus Binataceae bacterium]|nr:hypothetical protein [Candidatus Binataceae bacterium]
MTNEAKYTALCPHATFVIKSSIQKGKTVTVVLKESATQAPKKGTFSIMRSARKSSKKALNEAAEIAEIKRRRGGPGAPQFDDGMDLRPIGELPPIRASWAAFLRDRGFPVHPAQKIKPD